MHSVSGRRRRQHISDVAQDLNWMSAKQLHNYHASCNICFAFITGQPEYIRRTIGAPASRRHTHDTRRADRPTMPRIRAEAARRSCYSGISTLNELRLAPHDRVFHASRCVPSRYYFYFRRCFILDVEKSACL